MGIESPTGELINWLVEGAVERTMISAVGTGGLGKTILAKKVYDNKWSCPRAADDSCFVELGFQKLKRLLLFNLKALKTLNIHEGALPILERIAIQPSPQMEVPSGIHLLKTLTKIDFLGMPIEFACSMLPQDGQNYNIVEHVPNVFFQGTDADGLTVLSQR